MLKYIFIALSAIVTVNTVLTAKKWKAISKFQKFIIVLGILTIIIGSYVAIKENIDSGQIKNVESKVGKIETDTKCLDSLYVSFNVGNDSFLTSSNGQFQIPSDPSLGSFFTSWIKNNELFLNIVIRNEKGEIIATIEGQTWKIYKDDYDYNNDEKGFEIVTPDKKVVFQIFLKDTIAYIRGLIMTEKKIGFYIHEVPSGGSLWQPVNPSKWDYEIPSDLVNRIFLYPREFHYGERDLNNVLNN